MIGSRQRFKALLLATVASLSPCGAFAADHDLESRLKAAYIYNFAKFVDWPQTTREINICVLSDESIESALRTSLAGKQVSGKPVIVDRIRNPESVVDCNIVYFGDLSNRNDVQRGIGLIQNDPVLTVSDRSEFIDEGGAVKFKLVNKKLRFEISLGATQRSGLKVSSKLLRVADVISAK